MKRICGSRCRGYLRLPLGRLVVFSHRNPSAPAAAATPVYAYADLEHVVMSHPRYSEYHRLELEYNAMVAQYQFEQ